MTSLTGHDAEIVHQFTQQAEGYTRLTQAANHDRAATLRALLAVAAEDVALEVACGPGSLALDLAPHVHWVTGIDLTPAMLEQAEAAQRAKGLHNLSWQRANAAALPFAAGSFSLVVCRAAFHHLEQPRQVFAEMVRTCRPGGRISVIDVAPAPDKVAAYDSLEKRRDPSHMHAHTVAELHALGDGLSVRVATSQVSMTPHMSLDSVLATSYPEHFTLAEIRAEFAADASSGADQLGFSARMIDNQLMVAYPIATVIWIRA